MRLRDYVWAFFTVLAVGLFLWDNFFNNSTPNQNPPAGVNQPEVQAETTTIDSAKPYLHDYGAEYWYVAYSKNGPWVICGTDSWTDDVNGGGGSTPHIYIARKNDPFASELPIPTWEGATEKVTAVKDPVFNERDAQLYAVVKRGSKERVIVWNLVTHQPIENTTPGVARNHRDWLKGKPPKVAQDGVIDAQVIGFFEQNKVRQWKRPIADLQ